LFVWYELFNKVVAYIKDEATNLNTFITTLINIVYCVPLQLPQPYIAICYGHAISKCCQYATNDLKVCGGMWKVFIEDAQSSLQKIITWTEKSGKSKHEWAMACRDPSLCALKLRNHVKTRFASKVILLKKTLEFKNVINFCYWKQNISLQNRIPTLQT